MKYPHRNIVIILLFVFLFVPAESADITILVEEKENPEYVYSIAGEKLRGEFFFGEALSRVPGLNVISKSLPGVQARLLFNGGTFEQPAVLVDGIKVNDPQTGHYNFDLPFTTLDYESINIINSAGAAEGEAGFSGIVNLNTAEYSGDKTMAAAGYAGYNTYFTAGRTAKNMGNYYIVVSGEKRGSAGYHEATDYDENRGMVKAGISGYSVTTAMSKKNFGAYDFYTPGAGMPSREKIFTMFSNAEGKITKGLIINAYTRIHEDDFILDENNPDYYSNHHKTYVAGGKASYSLLSGKNGELNLSYGYSTDIIESSNLGNHSKNKNTGSINGVLKLKGGGKARAAMVVEKFADKDEVNFMPSANVRFEFGKNFGIGGVYAYAVRHPNFTELYYSGPFNRGNDKLNPERVHDINGSVNIKTGKTKTILSGFYRCAHDLIEWGKDSPADAAWSIQNRGKSETVGAGAEAKFSMEPVNFTVVYTYIDKYRSKNYISKYRQNYLRNNLKINAVYPSGNLELKAGYEYKKYSGRETPYHSFSCAIVNRVNEKSSIILRGENLLNTYFEEIPGIPAPGRMLSISAVSSY